MKKEFFASHKIDVNEFRNILAIFFISYALAKATKDPLDYWKDKVILLFEVHFALGKEPLRVQFRFILDGIEERLQLNVAFIDFDFLRRLLLLNLAPFNAIESVDE